MSVEKVLFLSVSAGAGHVRAADALQYCAAEDFPGLRTLHLDVMQYVPMTFRKVYTDAYIKLVSNHPAMWAMLYEKTSHADPTAPAQRLRRSIERLNVRPLLGAIADFAPDAIVCTHFLPAEVLMHEIHRGRLKTPVWVQVTDFDLHGMWVMPHMRGYFAASPEIARRMQRAGIAHDCIHITGIPVMPAFGKARDTAECARAFGLDPQRRIVLLMGGGAGMGGLDEVAAELTTIEHDFQLVVLAGRNAQALTALQALATQRPGRIFPLGFTDQVHTLMGCADLVITKPGGLSTSECLASGLPMILNAPIPGQEERNADYLLEEGAALKAVDTLALTWRLDQLLSDATRLEAMRQRARAIGRPHAARDVLHAVLAEA